MASIWQFNDVNGFQIYANINYTKKLQKKLLRIMNRPNKISGSFSRLLSIISDSKNSRSKFPNSLRRNHSLFVVSVVTCLFVRQTTNCPASHFFGIVKVSTRRQMLIKTIKNVQSLEVLMSPQRSLKRIKFMN